MDDVTKFFFTAMGGLLPFFVVLGVVIFVFAFGGDLLAGIAHGSKHLSTVGANFAARLGLLITLCILGVIVVGVFKFVPGVPAISTYLTVPKPAEQAAPAAPPAPTGAGAFGYTDRSKAA